MMDIAGRSVPAVPVERPGEETLGRILGNPRRQDRPAVESRPRAADTAASCRGSPRLRGDAWGSGRRPVLGIADVGLVAHQARLPERLRECQAANQLLVDQSPRISSLAR